MRKRIILLAVLALAALTLAIPASAQDSSLINTITVSGSGTVYASPDVAYVTLGVQTTDADLSTAFSQTGEGINKLMDALKGLGIDDKDIQTSGVNVSPQDQYDQQGGPTGTRTYSVSNTVQVTVRDISKVEAVLTTAVNAGVNTIYNLNFGIQNRTALEQQARRQAINNANIRAQRLATGLKVTLGIPLIITESDDTSIPLPFTGGGAAMALASQPVSGGQLSVSVQVQVTYSIS
jgi:uncharacterized protein